MSLTVRRVVTGHDENGRAIVLIDEISKNIIQGRPGANAAVIWTSEGFPVDNDGSADTSARKVGTTLDNGTVFRVVSFGPGVTPRNHRTDSIDYGTVISGEIDMVRSDIQISRATVGLESSFQPERRRKSSPRSTASSSRSSHCRTCRSA
jgi:hypothetical protein